MTLGCKDIGINKSEFVAMTQFLNFCIIFFKHLMACKHFVKCDNSQRRKIQFFALNKFVQNMTSRA